MSPSSLMLVTCAVCLRLHEPKNPVLINSVCVSCTKLNGADLKCPQANEAGKEYWSYSLINEVCSLPRLSP